MLWAFYTRTAQDGKVLSYAICMHCPFSSSYWLLLPVLSLHICFVPFCSQLAHFRIWFLSAAAFSPLSSGWNEKVMNFSYYVCMWAFFFLCEPTTQHVGFRGLFQNVVINNRYFWLLVFFYILVFLCAAGRTGVRFSRHLDF